MELRFLKLEKRFLFDASLAAAVMDAAHLSHHHEGDSHSHLTHHENAHTDPHGSSIPGTRNYTDLGRSGTDHLQQAASSRNSAPLNILVVSNVVPDVQALIQAAHTAGTKVVYYNYNTDSLSTILSKIEKAADGQKISSIAFANHGDAGQFFLTQDTTVTATTLQLNKALSNFWSDVGSLIKSGGNVDLLACDLVQNSTQIVTEITSLVDGTIPGHTVLVSAATGTVGNAQEGGSWTLESSGVSAASLFNTSLLSSWTGTLSTITVTNTDSSGSGSLTGAIIEADIEGGGIITFNITSNGVRVVDPVINLTTGLSVGSNVDIEGYTQYGGTQPSSTVGVTIDGLGANVIGLTFDGVSSALSSVAVENYAQNAVIVSGNGNSIENNSFSGNTGYAILVSGGSTSGNTIENNTITSSGSGGIDLTGSNNSIENNTITGGQYGVLISGDTNTIINATISDSSADGIFMLASASSNTVESSSITGSTGFGVLIDGGSNTIESSTISNNGGGIELNSSSGSDTLESSTIYGNTGYGVSILSGSGNYVGSGNSGGGNYIYGNTSDGVYIGGTSSHSEILGDTIGLTANGTVSANAVGVYIDSSSSNTIGGVSSVDVNIISGNTGNGITISGGSENLVEGNYIGISLSGAIDGNGGDGINIIGSTDTTISNLNIISGNDSDGISLISSNNDTVTGNYIGTDVTGTIAISNMGDGVSIVNSTGDLIGEAGTSNRNVISSNDGFGIALSGASTNNETITNNYIGLNVNGNTSLGNGSDGINISDAVNITIVDNVVSGNSGNGLTLTAGTTIAFIVGNNIGTNAAGTAAIGNAYDGILLDDTTEINIGDATSIGRNIISGNGAADSSTSGNGIHIEAEAGQIYINENYIGVDATGTVALGNTLNGILVGVNTGEVSVSYSVISANGSNGIEYSNGATGGVIGGNYIGTDATGSVALANGIDGILINALTSQTVAHNLISGNTQEGIFFNGTSNSTIEGNTIGLAADGRTALANGDNGINLQSTSSITVGGASASDRNIISGNTLNGIIVGFNSNSDTIQGNYIGTTADGTAAQGNEGDGIQVNDSSNITIGNTLTSGGNLISGNGTATSAVGGTNGNGIDVTAGSNATTITGNIIGLNINNTALGNQASGILVNDATDTTIGNSVSGERNVISANVGDGITVQAASEGTNIAANYIGTDTTGVNALGNQENGISINNSPTTTVGGNSSGQGNLISGNVENGIYITDIAASSSSSATVTVEGNIIGLNINNAVLGNAIDGINISGSNNIQIGGGVTQGSTGFNIISGNGVSGTTTGGDGIYITGSSSNNIIVNNYLGTDVNADAGLGNVNNGVMFDTLTGNGNEIGDNSTFNMGNIISGNGSNGILINATTENQLIVENEIGIDAGSALANGANGILLENSSEIRIGGAGETTIPDRNIISGNTEDGINIDNGSRNIIADNYIGTNASGTAVISNGGNGITLNDTSSNVIGRSNVTGTYIPSEANLISGNVGNGIAILAGSSNNQVMNNLIGTNATGNAALIGQQQQNGVLIDDSSSNIIGDTSGDSKNIISGNIQNGIYFENTTNIEGTKNIVEGNYIGLGANGTSAVPNQESGILSNDTSSNIIGYGGTSSTIAEELINVISGNAQYGISLTNGTSGYVVQDSFIGTNAQATAAVPNALAGIYIDNSSNNTIGSTSSSLINIISGNTQNGIDIDSSSTINVSTSNTIENTYVGISSEGTSLGNGQDGIYIGTATDTIIGLSGTLPSNVISGNGSNGIEVFNGTTTSIVGNYIGINNAGSAAVANVDDGILVDGTSTGTSIGSEAQNASSSNDGGNVISGNGTNGIEIESGSTNTSILQNFIGTDSTGEYAVGNTGNGVYLNNVSNVTVGGINGGEDLNVISGNQQSGVFIIGGSNNTVIGDYIGVDLAGGKAIGNTQYGIVVDGSNGVTIGNTNSGSTISGNGYDGIIVYNSSSGTISSNMIGTDFSGEEALGNGGNGITFAGGSSNFSVGSISNQVSNIISGNNENGIEITDGSTGILVINNYVGLDDTGSVRLGNGADGILINGSVTTSGVTTSVTNNTIGGDTFGDGNYIGGNTGNGIDFTNGASGNFVLGNFIGDTPINSSPMGNTLAGIEVNGSSSNTLGDGNGGGNTIVGNGSYGIHLDHGTSSTVIQGNYIGTDSIGDINIGNTSDGVFVDGAPNNTIGGTTLAEANTISGNGYQYTSDSLGNTIVSTTPANGIDVDNSSTGTIIEGNIIGLDSTGTMLLGNSNGGIYINNTSGVQIINAGQANIISGNTEYGIDLESAANTIIISGNLIGTDLTGTIALGNTLDGVYDNGATNVTIGGTTSADANVISANGNGINATGGANLDIIGNIIGLNIQGTSSSSTSGGSIGNVQDGILLNNVSNVKIGEVSDQINVISGNGSNGIEIGSGVTGLSIYNNFIGTNITGSVALGNTLNGVLISGSSDITVGGSASGEGNVISGNLANGISIASTSTGNFIYQDLIGTNAAGNAALGNAISGVYINGSTGNTIGGAGIDQNVISGNGVTNSGIGDGILISGGSSNIITDNYIGADITGTKALGNQSDGIELSNATTENIIGTGNIISGNIGNGIALDTGAISNSIIGNFIGTDVTGSLALGNGMNGIYLNDVTDNVIGGTTTADINVISANTLNGIAITNDSIGTQVIGNYIGTDVTGTLALGNAVDGVTIQGTVNTTIGGINAGDSNVISANGGDGVDISAGANNTTVEGNYIGTDVTGTYALGNTLDGVFSNLTNNTTVGGSTPGDGNIISANGKNGVHFSGGTGGLIAGNFIGLNINGNALGNTGDGVQFDSGVKDSTVGGVEGNIISSNGANGVEIDQLSAGNTVENNIIGVDVTGELAMGNTGDGVHIDNATNNMIQNNLISGNLNDGVSLVDGATLNTIIGNSIGVDASGEFSLGNAVNGVSIDNSTFNIVGGTASGDGNIISGNGTLNSISGGDGVSVTNGSTGTTIQGNDIGTDAFGSVAIGNLADGIYISNSNDAIVGGLGGGNTLSGNSANGIHLVDETGAIVTANDIGTDSSGTYAIANGANGVLIDATNGDTLGGTTSGLGNIISGNSENGIAITDGANGTNVYGNYVGVNADQETLANMMNGILLDNSSSSTIGTAGAGNVISGNAMNGIDVTNGSSGDIISSNMIGVDSTGEFVIANSSDGILASDSTTLTIESNTISGNGANGIHFAGGGTGSEVKGNEIGTDSASLSTIGNTLNGILIDGSTGITISDSNVISANRENGISIIDGANNNTVEGNNIGLDVHGNALGNTEDGVLIDASSNNAIGGTSDGNFISANQNGINIRDGANGNVIEGNTIGLNTTGTGIIANDLDGIVLNNALNTTVGGSVLGDGNVISGNLENGIHVIGGSGADILGNIIGTNFSNALHLGNTRDGILIDGSSSNTIGGISASSINIISGNDLNGVALTDGTISTTVEGNYIGLNVSGSAALANGLNGILVDNSSNDTLGAAGAGNVVSGNSQEGISIVDGSSHISVVGNIIGLNATGTVKIGNTYDGIYTSEVTDITIGDTAAGAGNTISGNDYNGVELSGATTGTVLEGNFIGTDVTGTHALGNTLNGVLVDSSSTADTIGSATKGNVISGNIENGIELTGLASSINIENNYIGTDVTGQLAIGNTLNGILVTNAPGNTLGEGNVISANIDNGILLMNGSNDTTIIGNIIGLNATGTATLGNHEDGIYVDDVTGTVIGGIAASDTNTISGNVGNGINLFEGSSTQILGNLIGTGSSGTIALGNTNGILANDALNTIIGGLSALDKNTISGNTADGIYLENGATTTIEGNYIGTSSQGTISVGNVQDGIYVNSVTNQTIGGSASGAGNVISANSGDGIDLSPGSNNAIIEGNIIGLNAASTAALGNTNDGIFANDVNDTMIGGTSSGAANTISGNIGNGINLFNGSGVQILGNLIGTNVAGTVSLGNTLDGIYVNGATNASIGGTSFSDRNTISGNLKNGVELINGVNLISIEGNYIGTSSNGNVGLGNLLNGILVNGVEGQTIGGTAAGAANVISANGDNGIDLINASSNTVIEGNIIGLNASGIAALGNVENGIFAQGNNDILIGGAVAEAGNVISGNLGNGISLMQESGDSILGNEIGTSLSGLIALGNNLNGIYITSSSDVMIGGTAAADRNILSGNDQNGLYIATAAYQVGVEGNYIGINSTGNGALGNMQNGILLDGTVNETIGGFDAGNVISANTGNGIEITDTANYTSVLGNIIGLNAKGTASLGNLQDGIFLNNANGATIGNLNAGNIIGANTENGIYASGGTGNDIINNKIGTDITGLVALGNSLNGILLDGSSAFNIGTSTAGTSNVISGNIGNGIDLIGANNIFIANNLIGLNINGTAALANGADGVAVSDSSAVIGGIGAGNSNVISGNEGNGIDLLSGANVSIIGNKIGTDITGLVALGNKQNGVAVNGDIGSTVGSLAGSPNIISGNNENGIELMNGASDTTVIANIIGLNATGTAALGNSQDGILANGITGATIGGAVGQGNIISGNTDNGIHLLGSLDVTVTNNRIGTDATGTIALGNKESGVSIDGASDNTIGMVGNSNIISGNKENGIALVNNSTDNLIQANMIGVNSSGNVALANTMNGILIDNSSATTIGGGSLSSGTRNVISGNKENGILIQGSDSDLVITGNLIGSNSLGTAAVGNQQNGVSLSDVTGISIGNGVAGDGNLISGNKGSGISVSAGSSNSEILGNLIGTDINGLTAIANDSSGITILASSNITVGGVTAADSNVIGGSAYDGILLGSNANNNTIIGNYIGVAKDGVTPISNYQNGIYIESGNKNTVGGFNAGDANVIAYNKGSGITVFSGEGNDFFSNSIYGNSNLGIQLGNGIDPIVYYNQTSGPNGLQNYPIISSTLNYSGVTNIQGTLYSTPNTTFTLQFFSSPVAGHGGNGQGAELIATEVVSSTSSGTINFSFDVATPANGIISATATSAVKGTSEFSGDATVDPGFGTLPNNVGVTTPLGAPISFSLPNDTLFPLPAIGYVPLEPVQNYTFLERYIKIDAPNGFEGIDGNNQMTSNGALSGLAGLTAWNPSGVADYISQPNISSFDFSSTEFNKIKEALDSAGNYLGLHHQEAVVNETILDLTRNGWSGEEEGAMSPIDENLSNTGTD